MPLRDGGRKSVGKRGKELNKRLKLVHKSICIQLIQNNVVTNTFWNNLVWAFGLFKSSPVERKIMDGTSFSDKTFKGLQSTYKL